MKLRIAYNTGDVYIASGIETCNIVASKSGADVAVTYGTDFGPEESTAIGTLDVVYIDGEQVFPQV